MNGPRTSHKSVNDNVFGVSLGPFCEIVKVVFCLNRGQKA